MNNKLTIYAAVDVLKVVTAVPLLLMCVTAVSQGQHNKIGKGQQHGTCSYLSLVMTHMSPRQWWWGFLTGCFVKWAICVRCYVFRYILRGRSRRWIMVCSMQTLSGWRSLRILSGANSLEWSKYKNLGFMRLAVQRQMECLLLGWLAKHLLSTWWAVSWV